MAILALRKCLNGIYEVNTYAKITQIIHKCCLGFLFDKM